MDNDYDKAVEQRAELRYTPPAEPIQEPLMDTAFAVRVDLGDYFQRLIQRCTNASLLQAVEEELTEAYKRLSDRRQEIHLKLYGLPAE